MVMVEAVLKVSLLSGMITVSGLKIFYAYGYSYRDHMARAYSTDLGFLVHCRHLTIPGFIA